MNEWVSISPEQVIPSPKQVSKLGYFKSCGVYSFIHWFIQLSARSCLRDILSAQATLKTSCHLQEPLQSSQYLPVAQVVFKDLSEKGGLHSPMHLLQRSSQTISSGRSPSLTFALTIHLYISSIYICTPEVFTAKYFLFLVHPVHIQPTIVYHSASHRLASPPLDLNQLAKLISTLHLFLFAGEQEGKYKSANTLLTLIRMQLLSQNLN